MKLSNDYLNFCNELLETTLENYRLGCAKPIQFALEKYGDSFTHTLYMQMKNRLPLTDQVLMQQAANARENAVMAARRGELVMAERLFTEARAPLESNSLSLEGRLLHRSFLEQAETYLDYRNGDFDRVYARTSEALAIDVVLEEEYGYKILHIHRIQLLHNLVRTEARRMRFEHAIELASQLLAYLEGVLEVLPFSGFWGSEYVVHQPKEVVAATFAQIASEVAVILAGKNPQLASEMLAVVKHHIQLQACGSHYGHPRAYAWFLIKEAFVGNDIATFLERASHFLAEGRTDTPLLWYATVVDLVALCNDFDEPCSLVVKREVALDAASWKLFPQRFFALLGIHSKVG